MSHSKHDFNTTVLTAIGAITGTSFGEYIFNILGTFLLGLIGAAGGYAFAVLIRPHIDAWIQKRKDRKKAG